MNAPQILFATCDHLPTATASDQVLARELEARGASVTAIPWSSIGEDTPADLVVLRSTWDYHRRINEFRAWLTVMEKAGRRMVNPVETVRWNLDKGYLNELNVLGIAIPETRFEASLTPVRLHELMAIQGWPVAVVKPRVSATAHGTFKVKHGESPPTMTTTPGQADVLVQRFIPEVAEVGELSVLFFGGEFSHAALKRPKRGDFRVQTDFGGSAEPVAPSRSAVEAAKRVLAAVRHPWVYARVDMVETSTGPLLMELELIEPHLFFDLVPESAAILAGHVLTLLTV